MNQNRDSQSFTFNHPDSPKRMIPEKDICVLDEPMIL